MQNDLITWNILILMFSQSCQFKFFDTNNYKTFNKKCNIFLLFKIIRIVKKTQILTIICLQFFIGRRIKKLEEIIPKKHFTKFSGTIYLSLTLIIILRQFMGLCIMFKFFNKVSGTIVTDVLLPATYPNQMGSKKLNLLFLGSVQLKILETINKQ